jgi:hypothetical protein
VISEIPIKVCKVRAKTRQIIRMNARRQSRFMNDEARHYKEIGREFAGHDAVNRIPDSLPLRPVERGDG